MFKRLTKLIFPRTHLKVYNKMYKGRFKRVDVDRVWDHRYVSQEVANRKRKLNLSRCTC